MKRRQFLFATAAASAGSLLMPASALATWQSNRRVVIAGAGLSGLAAAYELAKAGFLVVLIEARTRSGGRIFTLREPFADGLYVETGGEVLGNGYKRFLQYANELNVAVDEVQSAPPRGQRIILKGKEYAAGVAPKPHPYRLKGEEAELAPPMLLAKHIGAMIQETANNPTTLEELDKRSLAAALRKRGASPQAIKLMNISLNYNDIETVSAAGVVFESKRRAAGGSKIMRVRGGNSNLTAALASAARRAGVEFVYGTAVIRVAHNDKGVRVVTKAISNGKVETIDAAHFISTLPATTLREVNFDPALPVEKAKAIKELPYTRITKVFLQARRKAWDDAGYGGGLWTDTTAERILAVPGDSSATRGIFTVWVDGIGAQQIDGLSDDARVVWGKKTFSSALPRCANSLENGATVSWVNDRWAQGAYAHYQRGQFNSFHKQLGAAVGRLHFAGEHTAQESPGMEGALESAARVVNEIRNQKSESRG